ncbi:glycosyltransferase [Limosilactobacillus reuteri]|uniref:glycosyltransferase n=1 Tax=Limosilactobacillus reuteri TaxID=1598 RepID=UPI00080C9316|nr:glycosyltransferase [Limosilactobacillus reuteri]ANU51693.1 family 2 glycosyl transferase [Limosilactobacillus reuteri]OXE60575.1 family 2 glycosyl transferase [Limosilactobacillus reuteri]QQR14346.1 family 2 glycosyl transferase [Limosilactobacillus reuteri]
MTVQDKLFSIITIVNKEKIYEGFLKNLKEQEGVQYELIKINNDHNQFSSAREAYNDAVKKAHGDYFIFLHPDMRFLDKFALKDALEQIVKIDDLGVAGVSGCPFELHHHKSTILTTIVQGDPYYHFGKSIDKVTEVQTVDECFFVMTRDFYENHPFTDVKGWHMYAVEQCLIALLNNKKNYVIPARMWHYSPGNSENWQYVQTGREIVKRYGNHFSSINTTMTTWNTKSKLNLVVIPPLKLIKHKIWRKLNLNK